MNIVQMNLNSEGDWLSELAAKVTGKVETAVFLYQHMTLKRRTHTVLLAARVDCTDPTSWSRCFPFLLTSAQSKKQNTSAADPTADYAVNLCFAILLRCTFLKHHIQPHHPFITRLRLSQPKW